MRFSFVSSTTQDGAALLRDSWCATRRTPTAWLAAAATPRSRLAPCMNAAVRPSRSEKMTRTVRSSSSVTPERDEIPQSPIPNPHRVDPRFPPRGDRGGNPRWGLGLGIWDFVRSVRCTNVVLRARLAVLAHAAELEPVGVGERLRGGIGLGRDAVLLAVLGEAVLLHGRLRL